MAIFAIGDLHLSLDERIEKPMDVFGRSWADHDARLRENWINTVGQGDTVIICGDVSWGLRLDEALADIRFIEDLPGNKVITKGNHDLWWGSISKLNALSDNITFLQNTGMLIAASDASVNNMPCGHEERMGSSDHSGRIGICGTRGWICPGTDGFDAHDQKIYERELLRLEMSIQDAIAKGAEDLICSLHYPPSNDKFQESGFTEILTRYQVKTCVYGHLHGKEAFKNGYKGYWNGVEYKLVSLDYVDATPVKIYE